MNFCHIYKKICGKLSKLVQKTPFWIILHIVLFLGVFLLWSHVFYDFYGPSPGAVEKNIVLQIFEGQIPYVDFECEYPPIALLLFIIPGLFFRALPSYYIAFTVEMLLFDLLAIFLIIFIAKRINISKVKALTAYTLLIAVAASPLVTQRYDLAPAVMVLAAVAAFLAGKNKTAWGVLALGVTAKVFPIVVAPVFAIWLLIKKQYARLFKGIAAFAGVTLLTIIPWLIIDAKSLGSLLTYHMDRGLHAESTYGSFIILGQHFGWTSVNWDFSFGSFNITSGLADNLANASFYIMGAILLLAYALFIYQLRKSGKNKDVKSNSQVEQETVLIRYVAISVLVFLLFNKVFSAQYMAWFCPLIPLLNIRYQNLIVALLLIAGVFTIYIYPFNYIEFEYYENLPVLIMANRNILLIIVFVLVFIGRKPQGKNAQTYNINNMIRT
ncbi:MAG: glycosyltransferase family 87 protein [Dehalococcoidales bacterium]|nr:glycosyltransferase family 87 protein [Dehalococcoidales bacterium]